MMGIAIQGWMLYYYICTRYVLDIHQFQYLTIDHHWSVEMLGTNDGQL
jgi:hypothetical protein